MDVEQAILEVCQRFCSATGDAHDDACVALREAEARLQAVATLADRADARADADRRLVTTTALRAALLPSDRTHGGNHSSLPKGVRLDPSYCADCDSGRHP